MSNITKIRGQAPDEAQQDVEVEPLPQGWSESRSQQAPEEKQAMARYFAAHDFLLGPFGGPEADARETSGSVLVGNGTTPAAILVAVLNWMKERWRDEGGFNITWFSGGSLVAARLRDFKRRNRHLQSAARLFLFPGPVNEDLECVSGEPAASYVEKQFAWELKCALLSVYSFDMRSGKAYFNFAEELAFQKACARVAARDKYLFIDSSKMRREGAVGYEMEDLFQAARTVTLYTVSTSADADTEAQFRQLAEQLGMDGNRDDGPDMQTLRLCIVKPNGQEIGRRMIVRRRRPPQAMKDALPAR